MVTAEKQARRGGGWFRLAPFDHAEDRDVAPGAYCGDDAAPPWTWRRGMQNRAWTYAAGLVFLAFFAGSINADNPGVGELAVRIGSIVLIGIWYVLAAWVMDASQAVRWAFVAGFVALSGSTARFLDWGFVGFSVFITILFATLIPWRTARWAIVGWVAGVVAVGVWQREWVPVGVAAMALVLGWSIGGSLESGRLSRRLDRSEQRVSVLAVAAERERIGRDLHDILGHSLTAVSVKSELAAQLIDHDAAAARAEMTEVTRIAREALADVRATTSGMREVRLATEIASARSVLLAAGIACTAPSALESMDASTSELLGYAVREGVTNAVRHSQARHCAISAGHDQVSVSDDGVGLDPTDTDGSGLGGLRTRLEEAGGTLTVISRPGDGTRVIARVANMIRPT